ncbi:TonB-dependent receptor [Steroidobacter sp.]|uniref:TonB-dependent receptor n=1 Tax=Steroidobacter sp. TaxID=1978227 RepID=UPI001A55FF6C|nr:TonB-dependent receptor [Steroidobacter sp.]MBL8265873.1 TonB-dependent receptor [Steroidobacter sp.]
MSAYASCGALRLSIAAILATQLPMPAAAQASNEESASIESVTVTARRREESLQDVPVAISALTADQLQTQNVRTLEDMTAFAPNIKINAGRATSSTINAYIRGVGQNDPLWGFEPGVGIYIDDVYIARPQGALLDVYDVERIEVLRGPQGTLYGKNTIAGAIKYVTRDIATDSPTLNVSATGGSFNQREIKVGGSIPVVDEHIFLGAAVAYLRRDGYGEIVDDGRARAFNRVGQDVSDKDVLAARANATFVWGDSSRLRILADTVQDNSNAAGGQRLNDLTIAAGSAAGTYPRLNDRWDQRTDMPVDRDRFINKGVAATYTQSLTDSLDLKIVGAYREGEGRQFIDFDELNANLFQVPARYSDEQTSGEVQLTYTSDLVKGVAGVYYFTGNAEGAFDASLGSLGLTSLTKGSVDTDSVAVYFDTTWALTDRLNLNVGARWNQDDKDARVFVAQYLGVLAPGSTLFDERNVPAGFTLRAVQSNYTNDRSFSNVSPRLGMDFKLKDDLMLYFSYAEGFKSGGFDMRGNQLANPNTSNGYDAETADNFEVGMKSAWFDDTLQLNLTAFYTPYKDIQITTQEFVVVAGSPTNATAVLNAGKQVNQGVELETVWRPLSALTLVANVGYLDAEFKEFFTGCTPPASGCRVDLSGFNQPINSPDWTTFLGATYEWSAGTGDMSLHAGYQYRSATKIANTTASITDQDAYDIVDLGVAYTTANKNWRFAVEGKNILDEEYRVAGYDFGATGATGGFSQIGFYGPPRTFAVTATYRY